MVNIRFQKSIFLLLLLMILNGSFLSVQATPQLQDEGPVVSASEIEVFSSYFSVETRTYSDGTNLYRSNINGPPAPPRDYAAEIAASIEPFPNETAINDFPSYSWVFGCSAVSAAMIAGYYDRHGFPNLYAGPTNGGVIPLGDNAWLPKWLSPILDFHDPYPNNPLVASHLGVDGRTIMGSIDDYWWSYGSTKDDPYILGNWAQHNWSDAIGDYMKTSQSAAFNADGASNFFFTFDNGGKMSCPEMEIFNIDKEDATYGRKLFYEARGYPVLECYSQLTDNFMSEVGYSGGFSLADYKTQIDSGNPVLINLEGHSIVGFGYGSGNTIYIRNTWDNDPSHTYTMNWGGSYAGMKLFQVSVVNINPVTVPMPIEPHFSTNTHYPAFIWEPVPDASAYQYEINAGTYLMHTRTQDTSVCNETVCTHESLKMLPDRGYTWRVRAKIDGEWQTWSSYTWFNVASNFISPFSSDTKGWNVVFGPWALFNSNFYRSTGWMGNHNSIVHIGFYPSFVYTVRLYRLNSDTSANSIYVRGTPFPLNEDRDWNDGYKFSYTNNGQFSVDKMISGISTPLKQWTFTGAINQHNWNLLKVVGTGSQLEFYINNKLVWVGIDESLSNGQIGIGFDKDIPANPLWQPLLVDIALLDTTVSTPSRENAKWRFPDDTNSE